MANYDKILEPLRKKADGSRYGKYIRFGQRDLPLETHPTDFTVFGRAPNWDKLHQGIDSARQVVGSAVTRVRAPSEDGCKEWMSQVRTGGVAHHIYRLADGPGDSAGSEDRTKEFMITDRILVNCRSLIRSCLRRS